MNGFVTFEQLAEAAHAVVEIGGQRYKIRRLSMFERFRILGKLSLAPDGERAGRASADVESRVARDITPEMQAEFISAALVEPALSPDQLYVLPDEAIVALVDEIRKLSVPTAPFAGAGAVETS